MLITLKQSNNLDLAPIHIGSGVKGDKGESGPTGQLGVFNVFADETARDDYFELNPGALLEQMVIAIEGSPTIFQTWNGDAWVEISLSSVDLGDSVFDIGIIDSHYATLAQADAAAVAAGKFLVISQRWDAVPSTLSANVRMVTGGKLNNSTSVTFAGAFEADDSLHFIGIGAVLFTGRPNVIPEWWGAVGNGTTNDAGAIQAALNSMPSGGTLSARKGKYYLASSITLPGNVVFIGSVESVGSARYPQFDFPAVNNALYLSNSATINLGPGSTFANFLIVNKNLVTAYPFATYTNALSAIASYAGTAITGYEVEDCYVHNCRIIGFAQAMSFDLCDRLKIEWIDIDCTAGLFTNNVYDISRIYNIHAWPFVTYGYAFSIQDLVFYRSGSAFKHTGHFDGCSISNCFSYGYFAGFDIQCLTGVTLNQCWVEGGGASYISGQHGYKFTTTNTTQVTMNGCWVDTCDSGVYINAPALKLNIVGCGFHANVRAIEQVSAVYVTIESSYFYYPITEGYGASPTPFPTPYALIHINGGAGGTTISDNYIYGSDGPVTPKCIGVAITNSSSTKKIIGNSFFRCTTGIDVDALTTSPMIICHNTGEGNTADYNIPTGKCLDWLQHHDNFWGTYDPLGPFHSGNSASIGTFQRIGSGGGLEMSVNYANGIPTAPTIVAASDLLCKFSFCGYDGSDYREGSHIRAQVDGTPGAGSMPGNIIFSTTPSGSVTPVDRCIINNAGNFLPISDNSYTVGQSNLKWAAFWSNTGSIQTSDEREKKDIEDCTLGLNFINKLRPISYRWVNGGNEVDASGKVTSRPGQRTFYGLKAQQVKKVMDNLGIDFAGWVLTDVNDPLSQQALRYDQFLAPLIKAVQELSDRVAALEG
jgi:hypothetical protein